MDTLLLVDDNAATLRTLRAMLKDEYRLLLVTSGEKALSQIEEERPDLILLDIIMPGMDGFETYDALRKYEDATGRDHTPVIFLTSETKQEMEERGLNIGATDYIQKPIKEDILKKRIQNAMGNIKAIHNLAKEARMDKLTGFLNKAYGTTSIADKCAEETGCLALMDLDNFKLFNDLYGHAMGDKVLQTFSDILKHNTRDEDIISRIGGDEFLAFFQGVNKESAIATLSNRLNVEFIKKINELAKEESSIPAGISMGAVMVPEYGREYRSLFAMADGALYKAKQDGKHGYSIYSVPAGKSTQHNRTPEEEINRITKVIEERSEHHGALLLSRESFTVAYQFMIRFYKRYGGSFARILFSISPDGTKLVSVQETTSQFGLVLQKVLRSSDLILQNRTNQFYIILPEVKENETGKVIGRIRKSWEETEYSRGIKIEQIYQFEKVEAK